MRQSREDVLALPGIGKVVLHHLETMGGREVPSRTAYWMERGLPLIVARVLVRQGFLSLEAVGVLNREQFLAVPGIGYHALELCEELLPRKLPSLKRYWLNVGFSHALAHKLALGGVGTLAELQEAGDTTLRTCGLTDNVITLCRRAGRHGT